MTDLFLAVLNRSISAGWLVLAVLLLRLLLKRCPRWVHVLLWGLVAVRLLNPVSLESVLSLIPSSETVSPEIMLDWTPEIDTGIPMLNEAVNPAITRSFAPEPTASANPLQILIPVFSWIWALGIGVLLGYTGISYWLLRRRMAGAVRLRENIYRSPVAASPFVLGIFRPRIYLPTAMPEEEIPYVVVHEVTHIRRRDHWWKPLGFLVLSIYWFHPLLWLSYHLFCRDIELACDESVIRRLKPGHRAGYAQALLACSTGRRMAAPCPLAFGEVGVKTRIKSILRYKKPGLLLLVLALILCAGVAACFLTDPRQEPPVLTPPGETEAAGMEEPGAAPEQLQDLASLLEQSEPEKTFREMSPEKQENILAEYGSLLDGFSLLARETEDGALYYIAGHFDGPEEENPFRQLYGGTSGDGERMVQQLYREEDMEAQEAAHAAGEEPVLEASWVIENSCIEYSHGSSYVLIHPMDGGWGFRAVYSRYLSANGRAYLLDAASRGIALGEPEGSYLEVSQISPVWGEIHEKIPLTEDQAMEILAQPRRNIEAGCGFQARLCLGPNSAINLELDADFFTEFRGVPQLVLDLAVEKCGYVFASPRDIASPIVEAKLEFLGESEPRYAAAEDLPRLEAILTNASHEFVGNCGYGARVTLTLEDGNALVIHKGTDSCGSLVFGSWGGYTVGESENEEFWRIFGLDPNSKAPLE